MDRARTRMNIMRNRRGGLWALLLGAAILNGPVPAQAAGNDFEPHVGQEGKNVVWVPTSEALADKMLSLAKVTAADYVIDLGSGDGRIVIAAAKLGARALGVEYNADMVELAKRNAAKEGVSDRARFMKADLFDVDLSRATVVTMFLLPSLNVRLRPALLELEPGTRIVSNTFTMGEWTADESAEAGDSKYYHTALLWIVPANVEGTWETSAGELVLRQDFQTVTGTLRSGGGLLPVEKGRLRGDQISFSAGGAHYTGRVVSRTTMEGTVTGGSPDNWSAVRPGKRVD